jgi:3-hydroxybutyrate dehydrogenase
MLLHAQPTKKFVQIDKAAAFAAFLTSGAAASIAGTILPIEGGWTAQ